MIIRNKKTGEVKEIAPQEASTYGVRSNLNQDTGGQQPGGSAQISSDVPNQPRRLSDYLPLVTAILGGIGGTIAAPGLGTIAGAGVGGASGEAMRQLLLGIRGEGPSVGGQDMGQVAKVGGVSAAVPAAGYAALKSPSLIAPLIKALTQPSQLPFIGPRVEKIYREAGQVNPETLNRIKETIGTRAAPNLQKFSGIAPGAQESTLLRLLKQEIGAIGRTSSGETATPTFERLFELRKGAYGQAAQGGLYNTFSRLLGKGGNVEDKFYNRLGQLYSDILHEGVPGSQNADKIYGLAKNYEKIPGAFRYAASVGVPSYIMYSLLRRLLPRD